MMQLVGLQNLINVGFIVLLVIITGLVIFWILRKRALLENFEKQYQENINYTGTSLKRSLLLRVLVIFCISLLLSIIVLRPANGVEKTGQLQSDLDIAFVVDISLSMGVEDAGSDRIERILQAKQIMNSILDANSTDHYTLISYSNFATTEVPLTFDIDTLKTGIDTLQIVDFNHAHGSSVVSGLQQVLKPIIASKSPDNRKKIIIVIGDGEDVDASLELGPVIDMLKSNQVTVYTVGVGSENGGKIPYFKSLSGGQFYISERGGYVISKLQKQVFENISRETEGAYFDGTDDTPGLKNALNIQREQKMISGKGTTYQELYFYLVPFVIILGIVFAFKLYENIKVKFEKKLYQANPLILSAAMYPFIYISTLLAILSGNLLYTQNRFEDARKIYDESIQKDGSLNAVHYNSGNSSYRLREYTKAIQSYQKAAESPDKKIKEWAEYNKGNAQYRFGEQKLNDNPLETVKSWEDAIKSYENALAIDPNDKEAKENLEFVKKKLQGLKDKLTEDEGKNGENNENNNSGEKDKERVEEAEKRAKERYNDYGRYRNNDKYNEGSSGGNSSPKW